jgi:uncharacterized protein (UPF0332 family)
VAIINPEHLFEQADRLIAGEAGRPRQVDIRRATSAAYYGLFHAIITAAADQYVGVTNRHTSRYGLVYRSVGHDWLRDLCKEVQKPTLSDKFKPHVPTNGFGPNIVAFATAVRELQQKRHAADYDVMISMNRSDASVAIGTARAALRRFNHASRSRRVAFLSLLLFQPRW